MNYNNRGYPPPASRRAMNQQMQAMNAYVPANVLMRLIGISEKRYVFFRDCAMKHDQGFGQLHVEAQNMAVALAEQDPETYEWIKAHHADAFEAGGAFKQHLEYLMTIELNIQARLKRWLTGQPPLRSGLPPPPGMRRMLPQQGQQQQGYPQQRQQQQHQQQQPPLQQQPQPQPQQSQQRQQQQQQFAPGDMRDPAQAAAVLARAEQMPLGPIAGVPGVEAANPYSYAPPPGVGAPVQVQYAEPIPPAQQMPLPQSSQPAMTPMVQPNGATQAPHNGTS